MFGYKVKFKDDIFGEACEIQGMVNAATLEEAKQKILDFYPNIITLNIKPEIVELEFDYTGEYDI